MVHSHVTPWIVAALTALPIMLAPVAWAQAPAPAACEQEKAALGALSRQLADESAMSQYLGARRGELERVITNIAARLVCNGLLMGCVDDVLRQLGEAKAKAGKPAEPTP